MGLLSGGDIVAILGSVASIFGGLLVLLKFYFKQQTRLDLARKSAFTAQAELLKMEAENLKGQIRLHRCAVEAFSKDAEKMLKEYSDSKEAAEKVYIALGNFVTETRRRFSNIENGNHLPEEKPEPVPVSDLPQEKLGKVIVKK